MEFSENFSSCLSFVSQDFCAVNYNKFRDIFGSIVDPNEKMQLLLICFFYGAQTFNLFAIKEYSKSLNVEVSKFYDFITKDQIIMLLNTMIVLNRDIKFDQTSNNHLSKILNKFEASIIVEKLILIPDGKLFNEYLELKPKEDVISILDNCFSNMNTSVIRGIMPVLYRYPDISIPYLIRLCCLNSEYQEYLSKILSLSLPQKDFDIILCDLSFLFLSGRISFDSPLFGSFCIYLEINGVNVTLQYIFINEIFALTVFEKLLMLFPELKRELFSRLRELSYNSLIPPISLSLFLNDFPPHMVEDILKHIISCERIIEYFSFLRYCKTNMKGNLSVFFSFLVCFQQAFFVEDNMENLNVFSYSNEITDWFFIKDIILRIIVLYNNRIHLNNSLIICEHLSKINSLFSPLYIILKCISVVRPKSKIDSLLEEYNRDPSSFLYVLYFVSRSCLIFNEDKMKLYISVISNLIPLIKLPDTLKFPEKITDLDEFFKNKTKVENLMEFYTSKNNQLFENELSSEKIDMEIKLCKFVTINNTPKVEVLPKLQIEKIKTEKNKPQTHEGDNGIINHHITNNKNMILDVKTLERSDDDEKDEKVLLFSQRNGFLLPSEFFEMGSDSD